ncbi:hypothetical protein Plhal304r1_c019g0067251 [Plasmopara halstedii]
MTYYRIGQRLIITRVMARAMARSSVGKRNSYTIEKIVQNSKSRVGSAVTRPLGAALATFWDSCVAFNTSSEFLYFDGEDDDGTQITRPYMLLRNATDGRNWLILRNRDLVVLKFFVIYIYLKSQFLFDLNIILMTELRVSENFPSAPKACENVANKFFACFYEHGKQQAGKSDTEVGNVALEKCKDMLLAYNTCVDSVSTKNPKELFRVPEPYRTRE